MSEISFGMVDRGKNSTGTVIHASAKDHGWNMTLYLDEKGNILYPVTIKPAAAIVNITLITDDTATCTLPPSVPDSMVHEIIRYLDEFDDVVGAARKLIKEEQQKMKDIRTV